MLISFVIPCFNEQETITFFYTELLKEISNIQSDYEFIFIDDGSTDGSLKEIKKIKEKDNRIKFISFYRNFGKESAVIAGLEESKGDYVVIIDVDLQDPLHLLQKFYNAVANDGYDCAAALRTNRKGEPVARAFSAKLFYIIARFFFKFNLMDGVRDYRLISRTALNELLKLKEKNRFTKGLFPWTGIKIKYFEYEEHIPRICGQTKWSFKDLVTYGLGCLLSFSKIPLIMISCFGLLTISLSLLISLIIIIKTFILLKSVSIFLYLFFIIFFLGGVQLLSLGILGLYTGMIYSEVQNRPSFLIKEKG